ncbi:MAG: [FeFe] hydrogenase H-cluster radical SAM maturase HydE [Deltaproteobacteria bacterium]|nr:[FeFe] hydrogenase H-cluster radical SAM maturase HydE [Deltaproteobacteria bacterium]
MFTKEYALSLLNTGSTEVEALYRRADEVRKHACGEDVFLRGIIEFSNICAADCTYCGIRASNREVERFKIPSDEIVETALAAKSAGITTVVLQAGESQAVSDQELGQIIRRIKEESGLAITLSVGNRSEQTYRYWQACGMDRYLLRFETSDAELFGRVHGSCSLDERLECLRSLRRLGVQTGSGFLIGLPGERLEILADNIMLCRELDLDMIGIGPFIPHPHTPLGSFPNAYADQPEMFFKALAVLRIFNPTAHIPATTAFDAVFPDKGRDLLLQRGANVFMPNITPAKYRSMYLLYPNKPGLVESECECLQCAAHLVKRLGRPIGKGPGHTLKRR